MKAISFFCKRLGICLCISVFGLTTAQAEWHAGYAEEYFGAETTEKSACRAAESKAISSTVQRVIGESISTTQLQVCHESLRARRDVRDLRDVRDQRDLREMGDTRVPVDACQLMSSAIISTEGTVVGVRNRKQDVVAAAGTGARICKVSLEVDIRKESNAADTGFDPEIRLSQSQFRQGEAVKVLITPTSRTVPFYLTLFVFSPYLDEHEQVQKIYPSELDEINPIESYTELPSKTAGYEIRAQFPTMDIGTNQAGEILIALATKTERTFRQRWSLVEFNARMQEIPRNERRIIQMPYFIFASKQEIQ
jgi:hypothetical protein